MDGAPPSYHEARKAENLLLKNSNVGGQFGLGSPDLQSRQSENNPYMGTVAERDHGGVTQLSRGKELQLPRLGSSPRSSEPTTTRSAGSLNSTEQTLAAAAAALRTPGKRTSARSQLRVSQSEDLGKRIEAYPLDGRNERVEDDEPGRRLVPWHSQDFEKDLPEVSNFAQWQEGNTQFSKRLEASKEKKSLWNWKPFRAIAHIGLQRFNCMFTVRLHRIQSLPSVMHGLRLAVTWKRKDTRTRSMPARVIQGVAQFDETLKLKTHVFGIKDGTKGMKFEPRNFELSVIALDVDENSLGKHKMDLTRLLPKSTEGRDEENDRTWTTSFKLAGKASGGILVLTFGCQLLNKNSEPTSNLSSARFESPVIKPIGSYSSLPNSPEETTQEDWSSYVADYSPATSKLSSDSELTKIEHLNLNDEQSPNEGNRSTGKSNQRGQSRPSFTNDEDFPGAPKKLSFNQPATRGGGDLNKASDEEDDDSEFNIVYQGREISAIVDPGPPPLENDDTAADKDTVQGLSDGDADADVRGGSVDVIEAQVGEAVVDNAEVLSNDEDSKISEPIAVSPQPANPRPAEKDGDAKLPQGVGEAMKTDENEKKQEESVVEDHEEWNEGIVEDLEELTRSWLVREPANTINDSLSAYNEIENTLSVVAVESKEDKTTNVTVSKSNVKDDKSVESVQPIPTLELQETSKEESRDAGADEDDHDLVADEFLSLLMDERSSVACSSESADYSPRALFLQQLEQEALIEGGLELNFHLPEYAKFRMGGMQDKVDESPSRKDNKDSPLDSDTIADSEWGNEDDEELAAIMDAAEAELQKATQILQSKARAKLLEDEETKALMQEWGLNDKAFDAPQSQTSPDSSHALVPLLPPPPLGNGLGSVLHIRSGGSLRSMSPTHFQGGSAGGGLVMQVSNPVVLPSEMRATSMDILRRMAVAGMEGMPAEAIMAMPLEDITGKPLDLISFEQRPGSLKESLESCQNGVAAIGYDESNSLTSRKTSKTLSAINPYENGSRGKRNGTTANSNDEYIGLEDIAPMAMLKIEALALEGLKIQAEMADQDAPYGIEIMADEANFKRAGNRVNMLNGPTGISLPEGGAEDVNFMSMAVSLDEWMRLDAGVCGESETEEQTLAVIAAHNAAHKSDSKVHEKQKDNQVATQNSRTGHNRKNASSGLMGDTITLAMLVQLRDPLRNNEPVGAPMMALVQAERVMIPPKPKLGRRISEGDDQEEEDLKKPRFMIVDVTVSGLKTDKSSNSNRRVELWGNQKQLQAGTRWLVAHGMQKSTKSHPALKGKTPSQPKSAPQVKVQRGETLWSISARVHGTGAKWRDLAKMNPHIRNPDIIFPDTTIRTH